MWRLNRRPRKTNGLYDLLTIVTLIGVLVFSVLPQVSADNEAMEYLSRTPVTYWVYGYEKLEEYLDSDEHHFSLPDELDYVLGTTTSNDFIQIRGFVKDRTKPIPYEPERCEYYLTMVRLDAGKPDGKPVSENSRLRDYSDYARFFQPDIPSGYPLNLLAEIDELIEVVILLDGGSCRGPLVSEKITHETD